MPELSRNNTDSETTNVSHFFTNNSYHPSIKADLSLTNGPEDAEARRMVKTLKELHDIPKSEMT